VEARRKSGKKTASRFRGWLFEEQAGMPVSQMDQ
jgi:hypothetical protein